MSDGFDLDLRNAEGEIADAEVDDAGEVVLGVLDGTTDPETWVEAVRRGRVLLLSVDGDLNELAAPFAEDVKADGATLMHFREFLVVAPEGVAVNTDNLAD